MDLPEVFGSLFLGKEDSLEAPRGDALSGLPLYPPADLADSASRTEAMELEWIAMTNVIMEAGRPAGVRSRPVARLRTPRS